MSQPTEAKPRVGKEKFVPYKLIDSTTGDIQEVLIGSEGSIILTAKNGLPAVKLSDNQVQQLNLLLNEVEV